MHNRARTGYSGSDAEANFRQEERHMPGVMGWHDIHQTCRFLNLCPNHKAARLGVVDLV